MHESNVASSAPKKRGWLRKLGLVAGVLVVLVVVFYFVATSSGFFTGVILPRVGKAMNAKVTVSEASIHPFSEVVLKNLKVQTTGTEPLVTAGEVRLHYSLMDIIGGKINVQEVTLASATVTVIQNPDGTSNLDPFTKGSKAAPTATKPAPAAPAKPSKPMQMDLKKIALTGATIRQIKLYADGKRDVTEIANVNVTLDDLKNGGVGKLELSADLKMESHAPVPGGSGLASGKVAGKFDFAFSANLKPTVFKGNLHFGVNNAQDALGELAGLAADFDCDVSATEVKQISLHFAKGKEQLGEIRVSGPLDLEKTEGRLVMQILSIDKRLLNVASATSGFDFGTTTIGSSNVIQIARNGSVVTASGRLDVNQLQVTRAGQAPPQMDLLLQYTTEVDLAAGNAVLRELVFTGTQKGKQLLRADLSNPMSFAWGLASSVPDSTLNLTLDGFNLPDWQAFLGTNISAGTINAKLNLLSQKGGQLMSVNGTVKVANLAMHPQPNQSAAAPVEAGLQMDLSYGKQIADIRQLQLALTPTAKANNQLTLTGRVDMSKTNAISGNLKLTADALDLTAYYDTFAGVTNTAGTNAPAKVMTYSFGHVANPAPATAAASPKEIAPITLPFHNFTAEANIRRLTLHEVEITNLQTTVKLDTGRLTMTPFALALNGAPVTASFDADVSVPGFKYDLAFSAQKVPLAPLVNSFQPDRKGQVSGTVIAEMKIKGAGFTGPNLQTNLTGSFNLHSTNLNLSVANIQNKMLKSICEVIISIPTIAANPSSLISSLGSRVSGSGNSGSADDLKKSVINAIIARGVAGSGRIDLQETTVESPAFKADATGTITLAAILTNSAIQIPVGVWLERNTATRLSLLPANTPADATYAKLPDFFALKGTVADPKKDINAKPLIALALQAVGGALGGAKGSQLQSLSSSLLGQSSGTNSSGAATNQSPANALKDLFKRNK